MVTFTNSGIRDVYISGPTKTFIAASRIPFGAAVIRAGAGSNGVGTIKAAILEETMLVLGFANSDEEEHLYDGFYEAGEPVRVILGGGRLNALIATIGNTSLVFGDFLSVIDFTSGTMASSHGVLGEGGSTTGENRVVANCAKILEDVTLTSATYKAPSSTPTAGEYTIAMTSGDPTLMGIQVGEYIVIRDSDGTTCQVNSIVAITDTQITVKIPISVAAADLIHAVRQAEVLVIT